MKYTLLLILFSLLSCQNKVVQEQTINENIDFFDEALESNSQEPILSIYCKFTECGEWGGHQEHLTISKKDSNSFKLKYEKYSVDCDSMVKIFDGSSYTIQPKNTLVKTDEIQINNTEKQAILDFSFSMVKSKFKEQFSGHSGLVVSIINSDSTFFIRTYGGEADHYLILKNKLGLKE